MPFVNDAAIKEKAAVIDDLAFVWDRQVGETAPAHRAFLYYLAMGSSRRIVDLQDAVSHSRHVLGNWSKRYQWRKRADEYDIYNAIMLQKELDDEILVMKVRHMRLGAELQTQGKESLDARKPVDIPVREGLSMIRTGHDIECNAVGEASTTEKQEIDADVKTTETLPPEIAKKIGDLLTVEPEEP